MTVGSRDSAQRSDRFRITTEAANGRIVMRVEGWLSATSLDLLEAACHEARARGESALLELSGLRSLGRAEAERLARLERSGVELSGASVFVAALLSEATRPQ
jgi:hypothetical protein